MEKPRIPFPARSGPVERFEKPVAANGNQSISSWQKTGQGASRPMCFEVRYRSGEIQAFPYADFRGYELRHQGYLVINILGMRRSTLTVEGRWLGDLARHLGLGSIDWLEETKSSFDLPESEPCIERITFEDMVVGKP